MQEETVPPLHPASHMEDEALYAFLASREIDVDCLKREKIDCEALRNLDDKSLSEFLPFYGDRIALKAYFKTEEAKKTKGILVSALRKKLRSVRRRGKKGHGSDFEQSGDEVETPTNPYSGNQNALKGCRKIKLCMKMKVEGNFINVRTKKGGGPRDITISKTSKKKDLIEKGKSVYFGESGYSSKLGKADDYKYEIHNYEEELMDENKCVGAMYEETGLNKLVFYLLLTPVDHDELPPLVQSQKSIQRSEEKEKEEKIHSVSSLGEGTSSDIVSEALAAAQIPLFPEFSEFHDLTTQSFETPDTSNSCTSLDPTIADMSPHFQLNNESDVNIPIFEPAMTYTATLFDEDVSCNISSDFQHVCNDAVCGPDNERTIRVHRVKLMEEMIELFKDPNILSTNLKFEFVTESGSDMDGVSREAYSAFWVDFFRKSSEGEESRVPALNSKWQAEDWNAIGRMLAKGYLDQKVFPLLLSPITVIVVAFGEDAVSEEDLKNDFMKYISNTERETVLAARKGDLEEVKDEILDLFERFGCCSIPDKNNFETVISKIAHKEMIQKPKYATDNMSVGCRKSLLSNDSFTTVGTIFALYQKLEPSPKKVVKLLEATPKNQSETQAFRYLQQYVRGQNEASLKKLLRFLTGSEILAVDKIEVSFTQLNGLARRPIAHTCGPVLELPSTYDRYPDLRNEFDSLLADDSCFLMNIA